MSKVTNNQDGTYTIELEVTSTVTESYSLKDLQEQQASLLNKQEVLQTNLDKTNTDLTHITEIINIIEESEPQSP